MAVSASISSSEITSSLVSRYIGNYYEAALINAPGTSYVPGSTNDSTFMSFEATVGQGGYDREVFSYSSGDITGYAERGVALATKATIFPHDGTSTSINFTHVALLWGTGNIVAVGGASAEPTSGNDGNYTNLPTSTDGNGTGLLLDLTISNNVFVYSISKPGRNYTTSDVVTILAADLISAGAVDSSETTNVVLPISTVTATGTSGQVIAVVEPSSATSLTAGNEAAFYWTTKLFGAS
tara:strand:- start:1574 stop:2290 length:717 start_codon:yes stop_codon:yes gene_type:complete